MPRHCARAGLEPVTLSYKEGLALNNGTAQMLATGVLAVQRLEDLLRHRRSRRGDDPRCLRRPPAARSTRRCMRCVRIRARCRPRRSLRALLDGSTLVDIAYHLVPSFRPWLPVSWTDAGRAGAELRHRLGLGAARASAMAARSFYQRFLPFRGGKKHQPQDSYSLRCIPQVHGAVRDALAQAQRVLDIELNAVTDNPLVFPDSRTRAASRTR